jgi:hypothetical protein
VIVLSILLYGCNKEIKEYQENIVLKNVSGVWRNVSDGNMITINLTEDEKYIKVKGSYLTVKIPVSISGIDLQNHIITLNVVENGNQKILTLRQLFDESEEKFTLVLTLDNGVQEQLSFVRNLSQADFEEKKKDSSSSVSKKNIDNDSMGNLEGYAFLNSENGKLNEHNGVSIYISSTSYNAVSDINGRWLIERIKKGEYTILFKKGGFSTFAMDYKVEAFMNNHFLDVQLFQIPSFCVTNLSVNLLDVDSVEITGTIPSGIDTYRDVILYFSSTNNPSSSSYSFFEVVENLISSDSVNFYRRISSSKFYSSGFSSGSNVYCVGYGTLHNAYKSGWCGYIDKQKDKFIYTCLSPIPSNIANFVLP